MYNGCSRPEFKENCCNQLVLKKFFTLLKNLLVTTSKFLIYVEN